MSDLLVVGGFRYGSQFRHLENESVKVDVIPCSLGHYAMEYFGVKGPGKALEKKFRVKAGFIDLNIHFWLS